MSRTAHKLLAASGGEDAYEIEQSIVLDNVDDAHLEITPSSAGNQRTWTQSFWMKLLSYGDNYMGIYGFPGGSAVSYYNGLPYFNTDGNLNFLDNYGAGTYGGPYVTFATSLKDRSAWYHIVVIFDTTESTESNRIKVFRNNVQCSAVTNLTWPSLNWQGTINSTVLHTINQTQDSYYGNMQLAEYHFIDGTARAASDFAETDSDTGQWIPKEYEGGSYGTNGFYLKFVSGALGTDSSGEGNNLTASNLANADVMPDSPTNNFSTLNALANTMGTLSQGNLKIVSANNSDACYSTIGVTSGKWYWEVGVTDIISGGGHFIGVGNAPDVIAGAAWYSAGVLGILTHNGNKINNGWGTTAAYVGAASDGDIISVALDMDNGKMWVARNGTWGNSGDPAAGSNSFVDGTYALPSGHVMPIIGRGGSYNETYIFNFGQNGTFNGTETAQGNADGGGIGNFYYSPPSGFKALCSQNLPTPTIKKPTDYFNTVLYTGNSSSQNITGVGHQPDLVWLKNRNESGGYPNLLYDAVRGVNNAIRSDDTAAEADRTGDGVSAFLSDGFTLPGGGWESNAGGSYVAWNWKAGGSGSANNSGDINATVSANTTAGFSIVKWTANDSDKDTIAHGLGVQPAVVIYKTLDTVVNWYLMTDKIDGTDDYLYLNTTAAKQDNNTGTYGWQTSSTITNWDFGSSEMIAYCFAEVEGFSKFGNYTGNGAADGPFINCGFRPAFVIFRPIAVGNYWLILDNKRDPFNDDAPQRLYSNVTDAETTYSQTKVDFLSNGFKINGTYGDTNVSGGTILYMAWAESPFKYANAR